MPAWFVVVWMAPVVAFGLVIVVAALRWEQPWVVGWRTRFEVAAEARSSRAWQGWIAESRWRTLGLGVLYLLICAKVLRDLIG